MDIKNQIVISSNMIPSYQSAEASFVLNEYSPVLLIRTPDAGPIFGDIRLGLCDVADVCVIDYTSRNISAKAAVANFINLLDERVERLKRLGIYTFEVFAANTDEKPLLLVLKDPILNDLSYLEELKSHSYILGTFAIIISSQDIPVHNKYATQIWQLEKKDFEKGNGRKELVHRMVDEALPKVVKDCYNGDLLSALLEYSYDYPTAFKQMQLHILNILHDMKTKEKQIQKASSEDVHKEEDDNGNVTLKYESAVAKISIDPSSFVADDVRASGITSIVELSYLKSTTPRQGHATKLLEYIINMYRNNVIVLKAEPMFETQAEFDDCSDIEEKVSKLVKFYSDRGFIDINDYVGYECGRALCYAEGDHYSMLIKAGIITK